MFRAILNCTNVTGRASRSEYWQFVFLQGLIATVFGVLRAVLFVSSPVLGLAFSGIQGLLTMVLILPGFTVAVRRLHDTNRSGWWLLLSVPAQFGVIFLFLGGLVFAYAAATHQSAFGSGASGWMVALAAFGLICVACAVTLFVFICQKGTRGPNRFGPDPLDPESIPEADVFDGGYDTVFNDAPSPPPAPMRPAPVQAAPVYAPASPLQPARTFGKRR
ncbi:DUF805 domain-containing protein [Asticcacaulis solisilvae]|uniref:DUF805 domain-containing protein n=1 Tax=Asticcacaulis solisilvae TaxID=1217274 RepID=UPI003FD8C8D0